MGGGGWGVKKTQLLIFQPKSARFVEATFLRLFLARCAEPNPVLVKIWLRWSFSSALCIRTVLSLF